MINTIEFKRSGPGREHGTTAREQNTRHRVSLRRFFKRRVCARLYSGYNNIEVVGYSIELRRGSRPRRRTVIGGNEAVSPPVRLTVIIITRENVFFSPDHRYSTTDRSDDDDDDDDDKQILRDL